VNIQAQNAQKTVKKKLALPIITENSTDGCGMVISSLGSAQLSFSSANIMTLFLLRLAHYHLADHHILDYWHFTA
jgi:hypothetical protein